MNNALRITLIVFVLLLLVVVAGTLYKKQNQKNIADLTSKIADLDSKIQKIGEETALNQEQLKELDRIKKLVERFNKTILKYDSPPITYDYLLDILGMMKDDLVFNFNYSGQKQDAGMITNSYLIKGSAKLSQVYQLVSHLEKQSSIYYIYNLAISSQEITVSDTINYSFMVDSISENAVPQKVEIDLKKISIDPKVGRLFTCGLLEEKLAAEKATKERNVGLINLNDLNLIAVSGLEAFFRDGQGIMQILVSGDKIKDGVLTEVNAEKSSVSFMMDRGNGRKEEKVYYIGTGGM
jgi:cell division protein FtsL